MHSARTLLLAFGLILSALTPWSIAVAETTLRIATYNAEWLVSSASERSNDPWDTAAALDAHYEAVANVIAAIRPDILNLVEVTHASGVTRLVNLLHARGLPEYRGYHIESNDSGTGQDVAVISRIALEELDGDFLHKFFSPNMSGPWRATYCFQSASGQTCDDTGISKNTVYYVRVGGYQLGILGLHFAAFPDRADRNGQRTGQAEVAQKILRQEIAAKGWTPIVLGDLNDYDGDVPDLAPQHSTQTAVLAMLKDFDPASPGQDLISVARLIPEPLRFTSHWDQDDDGQYDPGELTAIDHILLHRSLAPYVSRVFIPHDLAAGVSDHWPVVIDLRLP